MRNYLILKSLTLTVLFAFTNKVNLINTVIDFNNKEDFPVYIGFSDSQKTKITIPAKTTKTITADHESTIKISASKDASVKFDLGKAQEVRIFLILDQQTLKIFDQNFAYMNIKPFRP